MVSDKIKTLRKEHKLTQEELAQKIYVSRQTISRWESGQAIPTTENIAQIAQYFEKDMRYFLPSYENISENTNEPLNETFFDKIKAFVHVYWKDICIFALALIPLVHILFTPVSAYSYIYARKNKKNYRTFIGLIVLTFSIFFLFQILSILITVLGLGETTVEIIMD